MSTAIKRLKILVRSGLPVVLFGLGLAWCSESDAQMFRGRGTRMPGTPNSQLNSSGWRPTKTSTRLVDESSAPARDYAPSDSGLGDLVRPNSPDQLPVESEIQPTHPAAGTPVPEHYYRGDWRSDPAYNPGYPNYPRYFGGFHSSHYYDLGIPNGDKGFRGNGIYWTPW